MGSRLKNPPVYFTLAQVRFNPILKLSDYLASIQDSLRRTGFPDFVRHAGVVISINFEAGQPAPTPQSQERYAFGNSTKTHGFLLDSGSLTFQSTDYGDFNLFAKSFLEGLETIHSIVHLDFVERVGLRYLDLIAPLAGDSLSDYLAPEAFGMSAKLGGGLAHSYCETLTEFPAAKLLSRVFTRTGPIGFPPDLFPMGLQVATKFQSTNERHAILDNDGFIDRRIPFSIDTVKSHLDAVHGVIRDAFRTTAAPHAFKMWDK